MMVSVVTEDLQAWMEWGLLACINHQCCTSLSPASSGCSQVAYASPGKYTQAYFSFSLRIQLCVPRHVGNWPSVSQGDTSAYTLGEQTGWLSSLCFCFSHRRLPGSGIPGRGSHEPGGVWPLSQHAEGFTSPNFTRPEVKSLS